MQEILNLSAGSCRKCPNPGEGRKYLNMASRTKKAVV
jgi:hypothetical protein